MAMTWYSTFFRPLVYVLPTLLPFSLQVRNQHFLSILSSSPFDYILEDVVLSDHMSLWDEAEEVWLIMP